MTDAYKSSVLFPSQSRKEKKNNFCLFSSSFLRPFWIILSSLASRRSCQTWKPYRKGSAHTTLHWHANRKSRRKWSLCFGLPCAGPLRLFSFTTHSLVHLFSDVLIFFPSFLPLRREGEETAIPCRIHKSRVRDAIKEASCFLPAPGYHV